MMKSIHVQVCFLDMLYKAFLYTTDLSAPLQPAVSQIKCATSAVFSWTPSTESSCVTMYTIALTNITEGNSIYTYNTTTNTTSITCTVSDFVKGAEYFFTVAGVDAEGKMGEKSVASKTFRFGGQFYMESSQT